MQRWTRASIIESVEKQVKKRISQKYNWKRTVLFTIVQLEKKISRFISIKPRKCHKPNQLVQQDDLSLGIDEYGRDVVSCLREYASLLISRGVKLHTLIVLGSRAKGRGKPESDVDVLVIASNLPGRKTSEFTSLSQKIMNIRQRLLLTDFPLSIGVEPSSSCSKEDFLRWLKEFKVAALDGVYYGKIIYDDGFWNEVQRIFKELEKKYRLQETRLKEMLLVL